MAFYLVQLPLTAHILDEGEGYWYELFDVTTTVLVVDDEPQQAIEEGYNSLPWKSPHRSECESFIASEYGLDPTDDDYEDSMATYMEYETTVQNGFYIGIVTNQDCFITRGVDPVAKEISEEVFTLLKGTLPVVEKEATPSV